MNILVTGGAGYVGSILVGRLLEAGHAVTVLDSLIYNQSSLWSYAANPSFDFVRGDARDERILSELIPRHDALIPLAALVGAPLCDRNRWEATSVNLDAIRLLNRLRSPSQLVVYPNTNSGYGSKTGETYCTEDTPLEPISLYGQTKVEAERELLDSPNCVTVRLATVFGSSPRMRLDLLVNDFVHQAVTQRVLVLFEKDFKRNYIHIRDVADLFLFALENHARMAGRAFNAGLDHANLSKLELALKIKEFVPNLTILDAPLGEDPDKRNYIVSNARLAEAGFQAKRGLEQGIQELIKAYRMMPRAAERNI